MRQLRAFLAIFALAFLPVVPAFLPAPAHAEMVMVSSKAAALVAPAVARADDAGVPVVDPAAPVLGDPTAQEIGNLISAVGGWSSLGTLGIIGLVIQVLMLVMKSKLGNFSAGWQLTAVAALSTLGAIVQYALVHNVGIGVAAFSASALAAYQVLGNQIIKKLAADKA